MGKMLMDFRVVTSRGLGGRYQCFGGSVSPKRRCPIYPKSTRRHNPEEGSLQLKGISIRVLNHMA